MISEVRVMMAVVRVSCCAMKVVCCPAKSAPTGRSAVSRTSVYAPIYSCPKRIERPV